MSKVRTFVLIGLLVGSMALAAGCCGWDPCDPLPDPCSPCASPCGTPPAAAAAPAAPAAKPAGCGGGKSCG